MKKIVLSLSIGAVIALPTTAAAFGPSENPNAVAACGENIAKQSDKGVSAGGGPKAGVPAPTNCDHFFQASGAIGNGPPGP